MFDSRQPLTMALSVLVTIEMLNALNSLSENQSLFVMPPTQNLYLIAAIILSVSLHLMIVEVPVFSSIFQICRLTSYEWFVVFMMSLPVVLIDESLKFAARNWLNVKSDRFKGMDVSAKQLGDKRPSIMLGLSMLVLAWSLYLAASAYVFGFHFLRVGVRQ